MSAKKLISVIMPAHNAEAYIEESIISILNQTFFDWELIILDDASTDKTEDIVRDYLKDPRVQYHKLEKQCSVYRVRNIGFEKATGQYITFLDSDDIFMPNSFQIMYDTLEANPDKIAVKGYYIVINEQGHHLKHQHLNFLPSDLPSNNSHTCTLPVGFNFNWRNIFELKFHVQLGTGLYRSQYLKPPIFRDDATHIDDYGFFMRLFKDYPGRILQIGNYVLKYRTCSTSLTHNPKKTEQMVASYMMVLDDFFALPDLPLDARELKSLAYVQSYKRLVRLELNLCRPAIARQILFKAWKNKNVKRLDFIRAFYGMLCQSFLPARSYLIARDVYRQLKKLLYK